MLKLDRYLKDPTSILEAPLTWLRRQAGNSNSSSSSSNDVDDLFDDDTRMIDLATLTLSGRFCTHLKALLKLNDYDAMTSWVTPKQ